MTRFQTVRVHLLWTSVLCVLCLPPALAQDSEANPQPREGFQWGPALQQAGMFLGIEHAIRIAAEPETRGALKGPFWRDYFASVRSLGGWSDGDSFMVAYIAHPMQGAASGFIAVQNDPEFRRVEFGRSRLYWVSRLRATAFAALYSEQFEIGPISQALIGNVQMAPQATGIVDHVITPALGLGWMVGEDALDRYVVRRIERWTRHPVPRLLARGILNPTRSFSNLLRGKPPWHRDSRGGVLD